MVSPSVDQALQRTPPSPKKPRRPRTKRATPGEFRWKLIGKPEPIRFLSEEDLNSIHWAIVEDFKRDRDPISPPGIRDLTLFGSAIFRPQTSLNGYAKYPTVAMAGAALFHAIVLNHPFHNGNKRTALVALIAFLDYNGWVMTAEEDDLFCYVLSLARHEVVRSYGVDNPLMADAEVLAVARWVQRHIRKVRVGEYVLAFHRLRAILTRFECTFVTRTGNRIYIRRGDLTTHVAYSREGMDVEMNSIHKIRRDLELDEAHGVDSEVFYQERSRIPAFIHRYRKILERLAEYDRLGASALDGG
jgi:death-on-curing family protein